MNIIPWRAWIQPAFAMAKNVADAEAQVSDVHHDELAEITYQLLPPFQEGSLFMAFYQLRNMEAPLQKWKIDLQAGLRILAQGETDDQGRFAISLEMDNVPEYANFVFRPPAELSS